MKLRLTAGLVIYSLLLSSSAMAQQRHIVDAVSMNRAVAAQTVTDQQNRAVVRGVLHQPQVTALANRMGLDITKADAAIATISGAELEKIATQARTANTELAGGSDTVVIGLTSLLLIIIIIILLTK